MHSGQARATLVNPATPPRCPCGWAFRHLFPSAFDFTNPLDLPSFLLVSVILGYLTCLIFVSCSTFIRLSSWLPGNQQEPARAQDSLSSSWCFSDQFDDYRESTIGAAFLTQTISLDESTTVKFEIWDTAGQERYKSLAPMYYRNANCAVVVYDITQASSLDKAKSWVKELQRQANENIVIALAGNKLDLVTESPDKRAIPEADAEAYAREAGLLFFETSAKSSTNVKELFTAIAKKLPLEQAGTRNIRTAPRPGVDLRPEAPGTQGAGACNC
ncbi:unnamed protein product [Penicillium salamii]|nr:unnamed protein product [Penicillium salamii]CAG8404807.1 unnamed protein product [Penicillium salamii]